MTSAYFNFLLKNDTNRISRDIVTVTGKYFDIIKEFYEGSRQFLSQLRNPNNGSVPPYDRFSKFDDDDDLCNAMKYNF